MNNIRNLNIQYQELTKNNLPIEIKKLIDSAQQTSKNAYAPYSNLNVGATVLLANKTIVTGNNQENAAYPSGICAERVAIFKASADYPNVAIKAIAITASSKTIDINYPVTPCGSCRQALVEYENKFNTKINLILAGEKSNKIYIFNSIKDLLPFSFKI